MKFLGGQDYKSVILVLGRLRRDDLKFEAILVT
jgi:hypothetical protein